MGKNKTGTYLKYAFGEIILVVIGILIALQINNWNEERIQIKELDGLMKSIARAIQSDVKILNSISKSRENISMDVDSIFNTYIDSQIDSLTFNDYAYVANTFNNLMTTIYYQPNTSSFESLKNSTYLSRLQGTDIELLLNTYYSSANRIQKLEEDYNQMLKEDYRNWMNEYRNNGSDLFKSPWKYNESEEKLSQFLATLNAKKTSLLFANGLEEMDMIESYNLQILLGEKFIEMINNEKFNFGEQAKIRFSNIIGSYDDVNVLNLLVNGEVAPNFGLIYAQSSSKFYSGISVEDDHLVLTYPENTFDWGSPYFTIEVLNGRMTELDFTKYNKIILEMKGKKGGEKIAIAMKDKYDPPDGTESRIYITLKNTWETYQFPIDQFKTADKTIIKTPLLFIFEGNEEKTVHVRSIGFE